MNDIYLSPWTKYSDQDDGYYRFNIYTKLVYVSVWRDKYAKSWHSSSTPEAANSFDDIAKITDDYLTKYYKVTLLTEERYEKLKSLL